MKNLLEDNKKSWDSKLKFALWEDRVTTKRSIGTTPFQLVYGIEVVFPSQVVLHVTKFLQDQQGEPYDMIRRMHQLVHDPKCCFLQGIPQTRIPREQFFKGSAQKSYAGGI
jgi:hypothetical protein